MSLLLNVILSGVRRQTNAVEGPSFPWSTSGLHTIFTTERVAQKLMPASYHAHTAKLIGNKD